MSTTIDGSAGVTTNVGAVYNGLQSATAQATTSGTSITFTGIPSWVKRITVMLNGVSTNGSSNKLIQIGSGSITNTGYTSSSSICGASPSTVSSTAGFIVFINNAASNYYGQMVLTLVSGNTWVSSHTTMQDGSYSVVGAGGVTLSGVLDRVNITSVNGTDTFDAGSVNIIYE